MKTANERARERAIRARVKQAMLALGFETTEARGRDALDFREVGVITAAVEIEYAIRAALADPRCAER